MTLFESGLLETRDFGQKKVSAPRKKKSLLKSVALKVCDIVKIPPAQNQSHGARMCFRKIPPAQTQSHGPLYVCVRNYDATKPITRNTLMIVRKQLVFAIFYCIFGLQKVKEG